MIILQYCPELSKNYIQIFTCYLSHMSSTEGNANEHPDENICTCPGVKNDDPWSQRWSMPSILTLVHKNMWSNRQHRKGCYDCKKGEEDKADLVEHHGSKLPNPFNDGGFIIILILSVITFISLRIAPSSLWRPENCDLGLFLASPLAKLPADLKSVNLSEQSLTVLYWVAMLLRAGYTRCTITDNMS